MQGKVIELFITHDDTEKTRESVQSVIVDEHGIQGDKFYAKDPMRSILLTATDSYAITQENNIELATGSLGENILIDINPYALKASDRLRIGNTELMITQNCTLCKGLSVINSKLPKLLKNDRGVFAQVTNGSSVIQIGDTVEIFNY